MNSLQEKLNDIKSNKEQYLLPQNILSGITILGVTGTLVVEGNKATTNANFRADHLLEGYSAVINDTLIQGTMRNYGSREMYPADTATPIPVGYYNGLTIYAAVASRLIGYDECYAALQLL
jgi:hypothetical protein